MKHEFLSILDRDICANCMAQRGVPVTAERGKGRPKIRCPSPFQPGFVLATGLPLRVMLVTQGHGGDLDPVWKQKLSAIGVGTNSTVANCLEFDRDHERDASSNSYHFYMEDANITSFHQREMRSLIAELAGGADILVTDMVKCYVRNAEFADAVACCTKHLATQIERFQPGAFVLLGGQVLDAFCRDRPVEFAGGFRRPVRASSKSGIRRPACAHGRVAGTFRGIPIVYSTFPSGRSADPYVRGAKLDNPVVARALGRAK